MRNVQNPMGCRWCGIDQPDHADWWVPEAGWHRWTQPTQEQIKQRMRDRRALRQSPAQPSSPMGCRLCGIEQRGHAIQATAGGSHTWTPPTQQQIKSRMLARRAERTAMAIPEHILNAQCPHEKLYTECEAEDCNDYLRGIEEGTLVDNSAEAWEEDWDDSPQLGGMGEELRQDYAVVPPAHYRRDDGVDCCVHTIPVGPNSCRACRELADEDEQ